MINNNTSYPWQQQPSPWTQSPWQPSLSTSSPWLHNNTTNSSLDYYTQFCGEVEATTEKVVYSIFMIVLLLCSLVGNSVVVLALLLSNKLTDRSTFYFVASLAVSDMVMATFQVPFRVAFALHSKNWCLKLSACYLRIILDAFGNIGSILNLFLVSTDRFIAVQFPFDYHRLLSKGKAKVIIALTWIVAGCWSLTGIVQWNKVPMNQTQLAITTLEGQHGIFCLASNENYQLSSFTLYSVVLVIMCAQYARILQVVIRQIRDIAKNTPQYRASPDTRKKTIKTLKQSSPTHGETMPLNRSPSPGRDRSNSKNPDDRKRGSRASRGSTDALLNKNRFSIEANKKRWSTVALKIRDFRKELKATKTIALVFLAFCLCWLPSTIITYVHFIDHTALSKMSPEVSTIIFFSLIDIFPMINTMINPVIYSFSNTQFRGAVEDIWRKFQGKAPKRGSIFASQGTRLSYCPPSSTAKESPKNNLRVPVR